MRVFIAAVLITLLTACSPVSLATKMLPSLFGDKPGISADVRLAGEANDTVVVGENERTDIDADIVHITKVIHNNKDTGLMIIAILGWMCPTPRRMWKSLWQKLSAANLRRKLKRY